MGWGQCSNFGYKDERRPRLKPGPTTATKAKSRAEARPLQTRPRPFVPQGELKPGPTKVKSRSGDPRRASRCYRWRTRKSRLEAGATRNTATTKRDSWLAQN